MARRRQREKRPDDVIPAGPAPDGEAYAPDAPENRRFRRLLFAVASAAAAALRVAYLLPLRGQALFDAPHRDSILYVSRAHGILNGDLWGSGVSFHSAPLYPYFLALVMGPGGEAGLWWVRVVQALLSALTVGFLALAAHRLFGRWAALATAALALLYAPFLFYAGELLEITLSLFFLSMAAWILARPELAGRHAFGVGALVGLAALGKPNLLLLAPVLLVAIGFLRPLGRPAAWPWRRGALLAAGFLVVIMPFTLRNRIVGDDWVLISSNGGINFFIGNNPSATGGFLVPASMQYDLQHASHRFAEQAAGRPLKPSAVSRFWTGRAWRFFTTRPGEAAGKLLRKTGLLLNHYEIPNHFNIYFFREYFAPVLRGPLVWYWLVLPLAAVGLVFGLRRSRATRLAGWCLLVVGASVVLFFITSRYRMPLLVWLLPFAGYGLATLGRLLAARRWRLLPVPVLVLVAATAIVRLPLVRAVDFHEDWITLANYWASQADWEKVILYNQQALRANMDSAVAWQNLGNAYLQTARSEDDLDRIEECLWRAGSLDPTLGHAFGNLAAFYQRVNRPFLAKPCLERALVLDPGLQEALNTLQQVLGLQVSDWEERTESQIQRLEEELAGDATRLDLLVTRAELTGMNLERYDTALAMLDALPAAELAADPALAARADRLRRRIQRALRYAPILGQPLPGARSGLTPPPDRPPR
ncbi:MAG: glycosyltransferase family 39 protein [Candidatus Krumholzibacteriota bacterium]|nr:glycosyltransferase family 39 protein [Candidatus Krumholzibacteriota bacterium]